MVAIARRLNSNAVRMVLQRQLVRISLDAHVQLANTDAVRMVLTMLKVSSLMDAIANCQHPRKKHAALQKMLAPVAITPLNTFLIWNMAVARDFGTAVVMATKIDLKRTMNVNVHALNRLAMMHAKYQRFMGRAPVTIKNSITIRIEIFAHRSSMAAAWAIPIVSKLSNNVNSNVLLINRCVSLFVVKANMFYSSNFKKLFKFEQNKKKKTTTLLICRCMRTTHGRGPM